MESLSIRSSATKNENGVSGSSRNYAWEQQPSAYLRHSYDLEFNSGTKDHGVCVCVFNVNVISKYITSTASSDNGSY